MREVPFEREEMETVAKKLGIKLPKNLGDLIYSFRYRSALPQTITSLAGEQEMWVIRPAGRGLYCFALVKNKPILPNENMAVTKVPDSTPGIVAKYALSDEQALLAKVRYNRLIDIFTGITCYSLQNHLRTAVPELGQVETDELYIGVDKKGKRRPLRFPDPSERQHGQTQHCSNRTGFRNLCRQISVAGMQTHSRTIHAGRSNRAF